MFMSSGARRPPDVMICNADSGTVSRRGMLVQTAKPNHLP
jgi:hypothetical protein